MNPSIPFDEHPPRGWEDKVIKAPETINCKVNTIGDFTLLGMLAIKTDMGDWILRDVRNCEIVVEYETCLLEPPALARDLGTLYKWGAKQVTLLKKARANAMSWAISHFSGNAIDAKP